MSADAHEFSPPRDVAADAVPRAWGRTVTYGADADQPVDARALSKLKWRCRRGLLENDLFIARFFERHEAGLTVRQARALETLMDLSDNDLLDLLLARKEPEPAWAGAEVTELLRWMRTDGTRPSPQDQPL
ncbi:MAG: hypothetical protein NVSMB34_06090 [Variovorax sp.]